MNHSPKSLQSALEFRNKVSQLQTKFQIGSLTSQLNFLGREINRRFESINCGGCCVYASIVAACLAKRGIFAQGIVSSYTVAAEPEANIDAIRQRLPFVGRKDLWNEKGVYFTHVGIELRADSHDWHYDTNGIFQANGLLDKMPIYPGRLNLNEMKSLADEADGWNTTFDRKHIPAIAATVKHYVSQIV